MTEKDIKKRLEYLRGELRAECISMDELHELQSLAKHIAPGDVELLEPAGVPEEWADNPAGWVDELDKSGRASRLGSASPLLGLA